MRVYRSARTVQARHARQDTGIEVRDWDAPHGLPWTTCTKPGGFADQVHVYDFIMFPMGRRLLLGNSCFKCLFVKSQTFHGTGIDADPLTPKQPPQIMQVYMAVPWSVWECVHSS